jgi:hypothetical protein
MASLAANVAVAEPTATGRVIVAWPSFALIALLRVADSFRCAGPRTLACRVSGLPGLAPGRVPRPWLAPTGLVASGRTRGRGLGEPRSGWPRCPGAGLPVGAGQSVWGWLAAVGPLPYLPVMNISYVVTGGLVGVRGRPRSRSGDRRLSGDPGIADRQSRACSGAAWQSACRRPSGVAAAVADAGLTLVLAGVGVACSSDTAGSSACGATNRMHAVLRGGTSTTTADSGTAICPR